MAPSPATKELLIDGHRSVVPVADEEGAIQAIKAFTQFGAADAPDPVNDAEAAAALAERKTKQPFYTATRVDEHTFHIVLVDEATGQEAASGLVSTELESDDEDEPVPAPAPNSSTVDEKAPAASPAPPATSSLPVFGTGDASLASAMLGIPTAVPSSEARASQNAPPAPSAAPRGSLDSMPRKPVPTASKAAAAPYEATSGPEVPVGQNEPENKLLAQHGATVSKQDTVPEQRAAPATEEQVADGALKVADPAFKENGIASTAQEEDVDVHTTADQDAALQPDKKGVVAGQGAKSPGDEAVAENTATKPADPTPSADPSSQKEGTPVSKGTAVAAAAALPAAAMRDQSATKPVVAAKNEASKPAAKPLTRAEKKAEKQKAKEAEKARKAELERAAKAKKLEAQEAAKAKKLEAEKAKREQAEKAKREQAEKVKRQQAEKAQKQEAEKAEKAKKLEAEKAKKLEAEKAKKADAERAKQAKAENVKKLEAGEAKNAEADKAKQAEAEKAKEAKIDKAKQAEAEKTKKAGAEKSMKVEAEKAKKLEAEKAKKSEADKTKKLEAEKAKARAVKNKSGFFKGLLSSRKPPSKPAVKATPSSPTSGNKAATAAAVAVALGTSAGVAATTKKDEAKDESKVTSAETPNGSEDEVKETKDLAGDGEKTVGESKPLPTAAEAASVDAVAAPSTGEPVDVVRAAEDEAGEPSEEDASKTIKEAAMPITKEAVAPVEEKADVPSGEEAAIAPAKEEVSVSRQDQGAAPIAQATENASSRLQETPAPADEVALAKEKPAPPVEETDLIEKEDITPVQEEASPPLQEAVPAKKEADPALKEPSSTKESIPVTKETPAPIEEVAPAGSKAAEETGTKAISAEEAEAPVEEAAPVKSNVVESVEASTSKPGKEQVTPPAKEPTSVGVKDTTRSEKVPATAIEYEDIAPVERAAPIEEENPSSVVKAAPVVKRFKLLKVTAVPEEEAANAEAETPPAEEPKPIVGLDEAALKAKQESVAGSQADATTHTAAVDLEEEEPQPSSARPDLAALKSHEPTVSTSSICRGVKGPGGQVALQQAALTPNKEASSFDSASVADEKTSASVKPPPKVAEDVRESAADKAVEAEPIVEPTTEPAVEPSSEPASQVTGDKVVKSADVSESQPRLLASESEKIEAGVGSGPSEPTAEVSEEAPREGTARELDGPHFAPAVTPAAAFASVDDPEPKRIIAPAVVAAGTFAVVHEVVPKDTSKGTKAEPESELEPKPEPEKVHTSAAARLLQPLSVAPAASSHAEKKESKLEGSEAAKKGGKEPKHHARFSWFRRPKKAEVAATPVAVAAPAKVAAAPAEAAAAPAVLPSSVPVASTASDDKGQDSVSRDGAPTEAQEVKAAASKPTVQSESSPETAVKVAKPEVVTVAEPATGDEQTTAPGVIAVEPAAPAVLADKPTHNDAEKPALREAAAEEAESEEPPKTPSEEGEVHAGADALVDRGLSAEEAESDDQAEHVETPATGSARTPALTSRLREDLTSFEPTEAPITPGSGTVGAARAATGAGAAAVSSNKPEKAAKHRLAILRRLADRDERAQQKKEEKRAEAAAKAAATQRAALSTSADTQRAQTAADAKRAEEERKAAAKEAQRQEKEAHRREKRERAEAAKQARLQRKKAERVASEQAVTDLRNWQNHQDVLARERLAAVKAQRAALDGQFTPERAAEAATNPAAQYNVWRQEHPLPSPSASHARRTPRGSLDAPRARSVHSSQSRAKRVKANPDTPLSRTYLAPEGVHPGVHMDPLPRSAKSNRTARSVISAESDVSVINPVRGRGIPAPAVQWRNASAW